MISINAERLMIEKTFGIPFKYPNVYKNRPVISGRKERIVPVILSANENIVDYAIWGMLPDNYVDSWKSYQKVEKQLYIKDAHLKSNNYSQSLDKVNRCFVIITGYFIYHIKDGMLYPYLVSRIDKKPFSVAGFYTTTEDGFHTVTILTKPAISQFQKLSNINEFIPVAVHHKMSLTWLKSSNPINENLVYSSGLEFTTHPLHRSFDTLKIADTDKLNPTFYKNAPETIL